jgi:hypothetical protein
LQVPSEPLAIVDFCIDAVTVLSHVFNRRTRSLKFGFERRRAVPSVLIFLFFFKPKDAPSPGAARLQCRPCEPFAKPPAELQAFRLQPFAEGDLQRLLISPKTQWQIVRKSKLFK